MPCTMSRLSFIVQTVLYSFFKSHHSAQLRCWEPRMHCSQWQERWPWHLAGQGHSVYSVGRFLFHIPLRLANWNFLSILNIIILQYFLSSTFLLQLLFWVWPLQHTEQTSSLSCPHWCLNLSVERLQLIQNPSVYTSSLNHAFQGALLCTYLHHIPSADALLSYLVLLRLTEVPHDLLALSCVLLWRIQPL